MALSLISRTSNPQDFRALPGIYIDEQAPPSPIRGTAADKVCMVGEFERGPVDQVVSISSRADFERLFGGYGPDANGNPYKGYLAAMNKPFGRFYVIRPSNSGQVAATITIDDDAGSPVNILTATASSVGKWGNSLTVSVEAATDGNAAHFNLRVKYKGVSVELHKNLDHSAIADATAYGLGSDFITLTRIVAGDGRPADQADTALATGADGTTLEADYAGVVGAASPRGVAILHGQAYDGIRYVFAAEKGDSAVIKAALVQLATTTKTKTVIISGPTGQTVAQAVTDVALYRDDRVFYAFRDCETTLPDTGATVAVQPDSWLAALVAALPPGESPIGSGANNDKARLLRGITGLGQPGTSRADLVALNEAGANVLVSAQESQSIIFLNGVTASLDTGKLKIARRTMTDFLQESIAPALVPYMGRPINERNIGAIRAAVEGFLKQLQTDGLLPTKTDLNRGLTADSVELYPYEIDTDQNTQADLAAGVFKLILRVRLFAHFEAIVLHTEIGETVVIEEVTAAAA